MENWISFSDIEYERVWNKVYEDFKFEPSISKFPAFHVPSPFVTYDVSNYFGACDDFSVYEELEEKALIAFRANTLKEEYILALDWQHDCFWFNPHLEIEKDEFDEWKIPIFPDGDYSFFIQKDFKWGYLGHPWERSITVFGEELLASCKQNMPTMFRKVLRQG
ncbi:DUF2716 domain-containing protein [Bacillus timonensis]|nr:DUF2716 domain-containing protein [Bacillus timonensis]